MMQPLVDLGLSPGKKGATSKMMEILWDRGGHDSDGLEPRHGNTKWEETGHPKQLWHPTATSQLAAPKAPALTE